MPPASRCMEATTAFSKHMLSATTHASFTSGTRCAPHFSFMDKTKRRA